jgi:hypothetical protein
VRSLDTGRAFATTNLLVAWKKLPTAVRIYLIVRPVTSRTTRTYFMSELRRFWKCGGVRTIVIVKACPCQGGLNSLYGARN